MMYARGFRRMGCVSVVSSVSTGINADTRFLQVRDLSSRGSGGGDSGDASRCSLVNSKAVAVVVAVVAEAGLSSLGSLGSFGSPTTTTCLPLDMRRDALYQSDFRRFLSGPEVELDRVEGKEREEESRVARKDLLEVILGNI